MDSSCRVPQPETVGAVLSRPTPHSMQAHRLWSGSNNRAGAPRQSRHGRHLATRAGPLPGPPHVAVISAQTRGPVTPSPRWSAHGDGAWQRGPVGLDVNGEWAGRNVPTSAGDRGGARDGGNGRPQSAIEAGRGRATGPR